MRILSVLLLTAAATSLTVTTIGYAGQAPDPLFADEAILALTLSAPFRAISRDRSADPEYRPGTLSYTTTAAVFRVSDVQLEQIADDVCSLEHAQAPHQIAARCFAKVRDLTAAAARLHAGTRAVHRER